MTSSKIKMEAQGGLARGLVRKVLAMRFLLLAMVALGLMFGAPAVFAQTNFPAATEVTAAVNAGGTVFETVAAIVLAATGFSILMAFAVRVKSRKG